MRAGEFSDLPVHWMGWFLFLYCACELVLKLSAKWNYTSALLHIKCSFMILKKISIKFNRMWNGNNFFHSRELLFDWIGCEYQLIRGPQICLHGNGTIVLLGVSASMPRAVSVTHPLLEMVGVYLAVNVTGCLMLLLSTNTGLWSSVYLKLSQFLWYHCVQYTMHQHVNPVLLF